MSFAARPAAAPGRQRPCCIGGSLSRLVATVRGVVVAGGDVSGERRRIRASVARSAVVNGSMALNRATIVGGPSSCWTARKRAVGSAAALVNATRGAAALSTLREDQPAAPGALFLTNPDSSQAARRAANGGHSTL